MKGLLKTYFPSVTLAKAQYKPPSQLHQSERPFSCEVSWQSESSQSLTGVHRKLCRSAKVKR